MEIGTIHPHPVPSLTCAIPPRSAIITGNAVETTVCPSVANNSTVAIAAKIIQTGRARWYYFH
jgi:hypothetical protein